MADTLNEEKNSEGTSEISEVKEKKVKKGRKILMRKKNSGNDDTDSSNSKKNDEKSNAQTNIEDLKEEILKNSENDQNENSKKKKVKKTKVEKNIKESKENEKPGEALSNKNKIKNDETDKVNNEVKINNKESKGKNSENGNSEENNKNETNTNIYNFESANEIGSFEDSEKHVPKYKLLKDRFELEEILKLSYPQLVDMANEMGLEADFKMNKQDLIFKILKLHTDLGGTIYADGVLDTISDKEKNKSFGFLRYPSYNYFASSEDIYVSGSQISLFGMKKGDTVSGFIRSPIGKENYFALIKVDKVNGRRPEECKRRVSFENLIPIYPNEKLKLEYRPDKYATRILDLFAPIGKGQRALIVAPPKAGKTMILQEIANAINKNHPEAHVIILLIDERPEEVTDMKENVPNAEVIASTFDEQPTRHVKIAELVIEKAKRLVEHRENVIILLDSITRLARAYNLTVQTSGKVLSGGVDANALYGPKKFFGAARNIRDGGSLTIIATALVETGSKMDEVIFEEFKGTGNMEVNLSRELAERRIFPAIDLVKSSTRKEELLLKPEVKDKIWAIRSVLSDMGEIDAITKVLERMKKTKNNDEFLNAQHLQDK